MPTIDKLSWLYVHNRKVLCARSFNKDIFYSPGGKREGSESDEEALCREIKEELGIDLFPNTIKYLHTFTAHAHGKPEGTMVQIKCFTSEFEGDIKPSGEIEELAWLNSNDIERTSVTGKLIFQWLKGQELID